MKSSKEQLESRGYVSESEVKSYSEISSQELEVLLDNNEAKLRTVAVRLLANKDASYYVKKFCDMLAKEKKLYTKLALCDALVAAGSRAIPALVLLIGKIGSNHYKQIGNFDLKKKSYPLPRDLAGRVLVRIGPGVFPFLEAIFEKGTSQAKYESLEIIGHISWNFADNSMEDKLFELHERYPNDTMFQWRIVRACMSFRSDRVLAFLRELIATTDNMVLRKEAERSLVHVEARN